MVPSAGPVPPLARAALAARLLAGAVLFASGFHKLLQPAEELALAIESYRLLPLEAVMNLARVLPWAELFIGAALILGYELRLFAAASAALYGVFLFALASTRWRGLNLQDCGCFGRGGPHLTPAQGMLLDGVLLLLSVLAFLDRRRLFSLDAFLGRSGKPRR